MGLIIAAILIWIATMVIPSGYGIAAHIPEKVNICLVFVSFLLFLKRKHSEIRLNPWIVFGILLTFIIIPYLFKHSDEGLLYLSSFLVIYIFSQLRIKQKKLYLSCLGVGALGLMILLIYTRGSILSGWNDNAISMIGLFSMLFYSVVIYNVKDKKQFYRLIIPVIFYLLLLLSLDCRSGMLFGIIAVVLSFRQRFAKRELEKSKLIFYLLNFPLFIALIVIILKESSFINGLNLWSIQHFDKTIFNGRDGIWSYAMKALQNSNFVGVGKFNDNYHNSAVAALSVFGVIGYICWMMFFYSIIKQLRPYFSDGIVLGCTVSFLLIFLQQTFDLGFISPTPNLIPYALLGIAIGRVNTLCSIQAT